MAHAEVRLIYDLNFHYENEAILSAAANRWQIRVRIKVNIHLINDS